MNNHDNSMSSTSRRVGLYNAPTDVRMAHIAAGLRSAAPHHGVFVFMVYWE